MDMSIYLESRPINLQSNLLAWLERHPQRLGSASQWLGMLLNRKGMRQEEIERSGLPEFLLPLRASSRSVANDELAGIAAVHLRACHPVVCTTRTFRFRPTLDLANDPASRPERFDEKARPFIEMAQACYRHPSMNYWIVRTAYEDLITVAPNWIVLDDAGNLVADDERERCWFTTALEAFDVLHQAIRNRFRDFGQAQPDTLFERYALLGGRDYQEWFVCLPDWPLPYADNHFGIDRLLIHLRTTERIDIHGEPLFMIEEIQSPWHAARREYGSSNDADEVGNLDLIADAPFAREWHDLGIKVAIWLAARQGFDRIGFTTGEQQCSRWGEMEGLRNLYDRHLPQCLRKVVRHYGCSYDLARIATRRPIASIRPCRRKSWQLLNRHGEAISPPVRNQDIALFYLEQQSPLIHDDIRVLKLSPRLGADAIGGRLPLFGWPPDSPSE